MKQKLMIIVPNLQLGGQEHVAVNTAEMLQDVYDVSLVIFDSRNQAYSCSANIININVPARASIPAKILNVLKRTLKIRTIKKKLGVAYTISYGSSANIVNVFSKVNDKILISIRGYEAIGNSLVDRCCYNKCDTIIACAEEMKERIQEISPNNSGKVVCLYNPYDIEEIKRMSSESVDDYTFSRHTIVTHGRLNSVKNYRRLINAFSFVTKEISDAQLLLIGEGDERKCLEEQIRELGLTEKVNLIGFRSNPYKYLAKSTLYVLSSKYEGFPNALVEGMLFLPVVAVNCKSGPREILMGTEEKAAYGILVKQDFEESGTILAEAIIRILSDQEMYADLKSKAAQRVLDFSEENYRKKITDLLSQQV